jgi:hypothetical protein
MKPALGKKGGPLAVAMCRVGPERKTWAGLNAANIGAEIDVIKPPCLPKLTLRSLFTSLSEFRALRSLIALLSFAT